MVHWGKHYGVRINGKLSWFEDYFEAERIETQLLYGPLIARQEQGKLVIMTPDIAARIERLKQHDQQTATIADMQTPTEGSGRRA